jgi:hypothetical protein
MATRLASGKMVAAVGLVVLLATTLGAGDRAAAAQGRPTFSLAKPHPYGQQTDAGNAFLQVAAVGSGRADGRSVNGAETKVRHEAMIASPGDAAASYAFSVGAYTTTGYWLQMGYLVLGSDGGGLARWFVQVLDCRQASTPCSTVVWQMSRAGAANPPPACSACSGDAGTGGYPFAFTANADGTWNFWFDGLRRETVRLGAAHTTLDPSRIYFLGEVTHPINPAAFVMGPRSTVRTLRLWSNEAGTWAEAAAATAAYATQAGPTTTCPGTYGIQSLRDGVDEFVMAAFHQVKAGSTVACTPAGQALWTMPAS